MKYIDKESFLASVNLRDERDRAVFARLYDLRKITSSLFKQWHEGLVSDSKKYEIRYMLSAAECDGVTGALVALGYTRKEINDLVFGTSKED